MKIPNFKNLCTLKDLAVYLTLRNAKNPVTDNAIISLEVLAEQCKISIKTIRLIIKRLEAIGWINVFRRTTQAHIYIFPKTIEYVYDIPELFFENNSMDLELKLYLMCLWLLSESKEGIRYLPKDFNGINVSKATSSKFNTKLKRMGCLIKTEMLNDNNVETIYILDLTPLKTNELNEN